MNDLLTHSLKYTNSAQQRLKTPYFQTGQTAGLNAMYNLITSLNAEDLVLNINLPDKKRSVVSFNAVS